MNLFINLILKILRFLPPEVSSYLSLKMNKLFFLTFRSTIKKNYQEKNKNKNISFLNLNFPNSIGLGAGLDKEGKYVESLGNLGFGFIEVGTFTPLPQKGNEYPRIKRLKSMDSLINRLGFNNPGIDIGLENLKGNRSNFNGVVGVSIGKNRDTSLESAHLDYIYCLQKAYPIADYIALNISSPNTEGLRELSSEDYFNKLIFEINSEATKLHEDLHKFTPLFLKISPDENEERIEKIIDCSLKNNISGFIVSNTTLGEFKNISGGISGRLLRDKSLKMLQIVNKINANRGIVISSGGISTKEDLQQRRKYGADLFQIYTSFIYDGPQVIDDLLPWS